MTRLLFVLFLIHSAQADVKVNSLFQSGRAETQSFDQGKSNKEQIQALHGKTQSHYLDLLSVLTGEAALPGTLKYLVESIKNHSAAVKEKLSEEHTIQSKALNTTYDAIATCDSDFTSAIGVVDGSDATSPKSLAAAAKASLCECRKEEAKAVADWTGCNDQLDCLRTDMTNKNTTKTRFLVDSKGDSQDMYQATDGEDVCDNSGDWRDSAGSSNDAKAINWFTSQKKVWDDHWDGKTSALKALMKAYNDAKSSHDSLKNKNVTGCDALKSTKTTQGSTCTTSQSRATMNQCYYRSQKKSKCDAYTSCRDGAEAAWTTAKQRETTDSQDRKDAWVAAVKIECIIGTITEDATGTLQIDSNISCENIACDAACVAALDLSDSLARTASSRAGCTLPKDPCETPDGWLPTCASLETGTWGTYTPKYLIGARSPPTCSGTAVAVGLSDYQASDPCEPCIGLTEWQESGFTGFTTPQPKAAPA